ncbi:MAG: type II toxin-antitoxin system VapC family toxin [Candidatus Aegiribacteria sp.]|nr:type II toxin-antitoxin system VapC family toxin [Candidatus Aegiribacteria sp.]
MKAVDTNVLIRFLVRDDEHQAKLVYERFRAAEAAREVLFIPLLVVLETIWVLESAYETKREEIVDSLSDLMQMPIFEFEALSAVQGMVISAQKTSTDLSDLLIGHSARFSGCDVILTFDKRASGNELFELLE